VGFDDACDNHGNCWRVYIFIEKTRTFDAVESTQQAFQAAKAFGIGLRFLTDFLAGDTYFKVHYNGHNLDRCRTQFKLVESIEQPEEQMNKLVGEFL